MKAREAAVRALLKCEKSAAWSEDALNSLLRAEGLDARESALAKRICAGVIQNTAACDFYLAPYVRGRLQPAVRAILRSAVCQLAFMDRIPASAAVNEAVELAKSLANPAAAKVVNAILRRLTASALPPLPEGDDPESLSVRFSHPVEWVETFLPLLGAEKTRQMLKLNNAPAPVCFRVNTLKATPEQAASALEAEGVLLRPLAVPGFFGAESTGEITALRAFREGLVTVQDPAAALPAYASGAVPGMRVLDCCAAPGGKSFLLAQLMGNEGSILSADLHTKKLRRVREGAERLGINIIETLSADASAPEETTAGTFDIVVCDAPCSGLGVIRKKPEIRYKTPEEVAHLPSVQGKILDGAARCVRPGGTLIYSTCTLLPRENGEVAAAFLERHPEFHREAMALPEPFGAVPAGERTVWPFEYETDGFYLCRMRREN